MDVWMIAVGHEQTAEEKGGRYEKAALQN